ncbi:MAG TPA: hypothetical protein PK668_00695 [Myxococcota bacterium]|nr:hypothetical protein [Myxococcota bacterium]HRY95650.1 hypothetical protein [Myxococcota bacterium]HSA23725.1 hypothetical protein [Myxococcota bacterium]
MDHGPSQDPVVVRWPVWMRLPGLGVAFACLAVAGHQAASAPGHGWLVPGLLLGVGLALALGLAALPWRRVLRGEELELRSLLGRRRARLGPGTRAELRLEVRNFLGGVWRLTLQPPGGPRVVIESYERGFHALQAALEARGLLPPAPPADAALPAPPARFRVEERDQDRGGLAMLAGMGAAGSGLGAWGLATQAGPMRLLAGLGCGLGAWLAWAGGAALLRAWTRLELDGARLTRRGPFGRRTWAREELAVAEERAQWNGADRTLEIRTRAGARFELDSTAANYRQLCAWLRAGGVPFERRPPKA